MTVEKVLKGILFDHTVLRRLYETDPDQLDQLIKWLREKNLHWVVLATHRQDLDSLRGLIEQSGFPPPDLALSRENIKKPKGSPEWIQEAANKLHLLPHQLVYVGDDEWDWKTALNGGTLYLHAQWSKPPSKISSAICLCGFRDLQIVLDHLFLRSPQWSYRCDHGGLRLYLRCLLDAGDHLPSDEKDFQPQHIFTHHQTNLTVGGMPAYHLLMLHALSNLYLEGLIQPGAYFCVYPGHEQGTANQILESFLKPATAFFSRSYYRSEWIQRFQDAQDTSLMRRLGKRPSFTEQTNTVCLNPKARKSLSSSTTVVVFDDFTTNGMSFEWARNLFYAGGAGKVVLVAIGKYGKEHFVRTPIRSGSIQPFKKTQYKASDFKEQPVLLKSDSQASSKLRDLFNQWKQNRPGISICEQ